MDYKKIAKELSEKFNKTISAQWLELIQALAEKELPSIESSQTSNCWSMDT